MAEDIFKPAGASRASKPDAGGGVIKSVPVLGVVKNNVDPTRSGRIQVYLTELGSDDPDNPSGWITVSYMSPFYGSVESTASNTGSGDFVANPASYGVWNSPPDLGSTVICIFINGDPNYGFYIGCVPKAEALHMVPAIGASEKVITNNDGESASYGGAARLPVTNINSNNKAISDGNDFLTQNKPIHSYQAAILFKQGLIRDTIRGPISSGAQRESPSRVGWGVSTPGRPIYAGGFTDSDILAAAIDKKDDKGLSIVSRRGGHTFVMDDGDINGNDQLVRLRSAAGHQILMSDDGQTLFIIHSNGQSWIELGKEGTIDMFSTNSFNVRTQGDINFHADKDINLHAKKKLSFKAEDIAFESELSTSHRVGTDYKIETLGKFTIKSGGLLSLAATGPASIKASGACYINGSAVNLNTGSGPEPDPVTAMSEKAHTDTMFEAKKGYLAAPGALYTIVTRAPAHCPWSNANQGVDTKTTSSANDKLPSSPSAAAEAANQAAAASPVSSPIQPAALATVPSVPAVSSAIDAQAAGAMVGAVASNAALGPAAAAVAAGAGVVQTAKGAVAAIGSFAQNPTQLESSGFMKPGSATLVNSMISNGVPLSKALTDNMFTGKAGISNLTSFVDNPGAQVTGMISNFKQSQTSLTSVGMMTGKESSTSIAGLVVAGVTAGVNNTVNAVKNLGNLATGIGQSVSNKLTGTGSAVTSAISSGNFATNLSQSTTGGLGALGSILGAALPITGLLAGAKMNQRGATAAAFATIAASVATLPRGPINLKTLLSENIDKSISKGASADPLKAAVDVMKTTGSIIGGQTGRVTSAIAGGFSAVQRLDSAKTPSQALTGLTGVIGSVGSIGSALGNKSLAKASKDVNSIIGVTAQVNRGLATVAGAPSMTQALGGLSTVVNGIGRGGLAFGNKNLSSSARKITSLLGSSSQLLRASDTLANSKNINQTLSAFSSIIGSAGKISSVLGKNSKSTGLFGLPGGGLSVGSIVNKSLGSLGIPKNPILSSIINNTVTSTINKIAFPQSVKGAANSALGAGAGLAAAGTSAASSGLLAEINSVASSVGNQLSQAVTGIQETGKSLVSMATSSLSPNEAGPLNAAMSAVGFGGAGAIKLPSIGINTNDVADVKAQMSSLLSDSRIPKPNFGKDETSEATAKLEEVIQQNDQVTSALNELQSLTALVDFAKENYYELDNTLPPGDPQIAEARNQWESLSRQLEDAVRAIDDLMK